MSEGLRTLLSYIVARFVAADEYRAIERSAGAQVQGDAIEAGKAAATKREQAVAGGQVEAFAHASQRAFRHHRQGETWIALDDRDPDQNAMADALIDYLVRFDLATTSVRETGGQHYIYDISVDWDRLRGVAAEGGLRLDDLLGQSHGAS